MKKILITMFFILLLASTAFGFGFFGFPDHHMFSGSTSYEVFNVTDNGGEAFRVTDSGGEDFNVRQ